MQEVHVWSERLDLGMDELDREHHLQIALASALIEAIERGRPKVARQLGEQLAEYSGAHFLGEELLMETRGYGQLAAHRQEHQSILNQIREVLELLGNSEYELALPMAFDLRSGLGSHIATFDRKYAEYASETRNRAE